MSKVVAQIIVDKLGRKFATTKTGFVIREVKAMPEMAEFNDSQIRYGLDLAVKGGHMRKVAHPTIKLQDGSAQAIAFTSVNNPHTKDKPDYSLTDHPKFAASRQSRKANTIARKNGDPSAPIKRHPTTDEILSLLTENEGILRRDFIVLLQSKGLSLANAQYHLAACVKRGEIVAFGSRGHSTIMTKAYRVGQVKQQAEQERLAKQEKAAGIQAVPSTPAASPVEIPVITSPTLDTISTHLRSLGESIANNLTHYIVERVTANLAQFVQGIGSVETPKPEDLKKAVDIAIQTKEREKKQKVVVVGLIPSQAGMMQTEFGERLNLDFIGADDMTKAQKAIGYADHVIGMTNFINHPIEGQIKNHSSYTRISGGLTQLRHKLQNFAQQQCAH